MKLPSTATRSVEINYSECLKFGKNKKREKTKNKQLILPTPKI